MSWVIVLSYMSYISHNPALPGLPGPWIHHNCQFCICALLDFFWKALPKVSSHLKCQRNKKTVMILHPSSEDPELWTKEQRYTVFWKPRSLFTSISIWVSLQEFSVTIATKVLEVSAVISTARWYYKQNMAEIDLKASELYHIEIVDRQRKPAYSIGSSFQPHAQVT